MIETVLQIVFAPVRLLLNALPTEANLREEMRRSASLTFECSSEGILVRPVRMRHQGQRGASAVSRAMRHIQPTIASVRPYTRREGAKFRRLTGHVPIGPGHLTYKLPLEFPRLSPYHDEQMWNALCKKVCGLSSPITLAEFEDLEIASYVETRPPSFEATAYYQSYR